MRLRVCATLAFFLGLGLVLKIWMLSGLVSPGTYARVIAVDAGLTCALLLFTFLSLSHFEARLRELIRSLAVFIQGRRDHRVPTEFGGYLSDLGLQINEVLALASGEPEAGVRRLARRSRTNFNADETPPSTGQQTLFNLADTAAGEGVGPVRVVQRSEGLDRDLGRDPGRTRGLPAAKPSPHGAVFDTEISELANPDDDPLERTDPSFPPNIDAETSEPAAAMPRDTLPPEPALEPTLPETPVQAQEHAIAESSPAIDIAPALSMPDQVEPAVFQLDDGQQERRELYHAFVAEKRRLGETVDNFDFASFEELLEEVASQLKTERGCEQVRFDIRIAAGKVALQPRLVRQKAQVS